MKPRHHEVPWGAFQSPGPRSQAGPHALDNVRSNCCSASVVLSRNFQIQLFQTALIRSAVKYTLQVAFNENAVVVGKGLPFASCLFCLYAASGSQALKLPGENELMNENEGGGLGLDTGQTHTHASCLQSLFCLNQYDSSRQATWFHRGAVPSSAQSGTETLLECTSTNSTFAFLILL